jgi:hypothetical protein
MSAILSVYLVAVNRLAGAMREGPLGYQQIMSILLRVFGTLPHAPEHLYHAAKLAELVADLCDRLMVGSACE